jgi:RNA-binding protein YlmH
MKTNIYNTEKIIGYLKSRGYTSFLTKKEEIETKKHLNKNEYKIYEPYPDCSKTILYKKDIPNIKLYKIVSKIELRHQEILGTIFSLGLKEDTFGDIVKYNNEYYIFILPSIEEYLKYNLTVINNNPVLLEEVDLNTKDNFIQEYIKKEYIVSSLRIDNVISSITNESRNQVLEHFKNKEIILNYEEEIKPTRILREGDTFSIRRVGKYKYSGIIKNTKKGGYIIEILAYK